MKELGPQSNNYTCVVPFSGGVESTALVKYLVKRKEIIDSQIEDLFNLDKQKLRENILNYQDYFKQEEFDNNMDAFLEDEEKFDSMAFYELWDILIMLVKREIRMIDTREQIVKDVDSMISKEKSEKYLSMIFHATRK